MFTIDPPPRSTMCGIAWREQVKMPQRFVSSTRSYSSRVVSATALQQTDAGVVAEHVEPPEAGRRLADEALGIVLVADVGGHEHDVRVPRAASARASSSPSSAARCEATTAAPSAARRSTIARPMPRPAPVTIATLPASR